MKIFWATRDYDFDNFYIEEANPRNRENIGLDQVWQFNHSDMESEVYVEEETLEKATIKALDLFRR